MPINVSSRLVLALLSLLVALPIAALAQAPAAANSALQKYVDGLNPGWNLGNTLDATGEETSWGNPLTTRALIDRIASEGFKSIRIPITWKHRMGDAPDFAIQPQFMARVKEIVDWSLAAGLHVMINLHHDSHWIHDMEKDRETVQARFDAAWRQIAPAFRDYPHTLMFEGINEPRFSSDWNRDEPIYYDMLKSLNDAFVKIVRETGGNNATRPLVLSTLTASAAEARLEVLYQTITAYNDPALIGTFHYYGYWPFSVNIAGATTFNEASQKDVEQTFDRAHKALVERGIPVIVGEYGLLGFDKSVSVIQHGEILKFFESVGHHARRTGMPLMWWDNGQHFDRRAMQWRDPRLLEMVLTSAEGRSSTSERDSIYLKRGEAIADRTMKLNLHGNTLEKLGVDGRELRRGNDWDLQGDTLTLKASLIQSLTTDKLERNASITCQFSSGAPWLIHLVHYDTPVLSEAAGEARSFVIPVAFNGDRLATMEARYPDGTNAGPANWTPFKEFHNTFRPDHEAGTIQLMPAFFRDVKDGDVTLRFHFWSGEILEYRLTKTGNQIEGKPAGQ